MAERENPYRKILDDAKRALSEKHSNLDYLDARPKSPERVSIPDFPFGRPAKRDAGWNKTPNPQFYTMI